MLSDDIEDKNPNVAGWKEKYQISLAADILLAKDLGERSAVAWHHNL